MSAPTTSVAVIPTCTVTRKLHEPVFPLASVTVHVTTLVPNGKVDPLGGAHTTVAPPQLSCPAGATHPTTWLHPPVVFVTTLAGHATVGLCVSLTVTVKLHVAVFPLASVTTNVFTVLPFGKADPLARPAVCATVWPGQLSLLLTV
jgi:hypothetical protein